MSGSDGGNAAVRAVICEVFRSPRREGMYLYVDRSEGLARVPEGLLHGFGPPEPALVLRLDAQRRLARADAAEVLNALRDTGYYLQMPPSPTATDNGDAAGRDHADDQGTPFPC